MARLTIRLNHSRYIGISSAGNGILQQPHKQMKHILPIALAGFLFLTGCQKMSEHVRDDTAGVNGSFETAKDGLPVNWLVYTPNTVPEGDFDVKLDTENHKEGKQSLHFDVRECKETGGWHSPGFAQEFEAEPGKDYKIGFWVRNGGASWGAVAKGVKPKEGDSDAPVVNYVMTDDESAGEWKRYEWSYVMPEDMEKLRFEFGITKPGKVWIDDITIEKKD